MANTGRQSFLLTLDERLFGVHKKVGQLWTRTTHRPVEDLETLVFGASGAAFTYYALKEISWFGLFGAVATAIAALYPKARIKSKTGLYGDSTELAFGKYVRVIAYAGTIGFTLADAFAYYAGHDPEAYAPLKEGLAFYTGLLAWFSAEYLCLSHPQR